jgi:hypothetical protein
MNRRSVSRPTTPGRTGVGDEDRMQIAFSLGKAYEDLKHYDRSYVCLHEGNRLRRSTISFDIREEQSRFDRVKAVFTGELFERLEGGGVQDSTPIFVLGMPRSGTTLVEQILACHPDVHGASELNDLRQAVDSLSVDGGGVAYPDSLSGLSGVQLTEIGQRYLDRLRAHNPSARFITDKMPWNFEYIGMIKLMLPGARIVHCLRNPMDNCFSIYKKCFAHLESIEYAYDQTELGQYYLMYEELMAHWRDVLPGFVLDIRYEDLVADQKHHSKRLLEFCGLEWNDACLEFHKTDRPVKTASAAQVRKPIYNTSVKAWKNYEKHLGPLAGILHNRTRLAFGSTKPFTRMCSPRWPCGRTRREGESTPSRSGPAGSSGGWSPSRRPLPSSSSSRKSTGGLPTTSGQ